MKTNIPTDHIRRLARMSEDEQRAAMPAFRDSVTRFLDREDRTDDETAAVLLGGLTRRSLFRVGGVTIAGAALLAACGSDSGATATTVAPATTPSTMAPTSMVPTTMAPSTTVPMGAVDDVTWLRTASSIEHLAVAAYQTAIDSGLVTTMAVADAAMRFQDHHMEHADFFEAATKKMGGKAFTDPNPAVLAQLQPAIKALKDEKGVIALALMLERAAAATYQSGVGNVTDLTLNKALMSVGGVEARHAAVLAGALGEMPVPRSFGTIDGAVPAGTGV